MEDQAAMYIITDYGATATYPSTTAMPITAQPAQAVQNVAADPIVQILNGSRSARRESSTGAGKRNRQHNTPMNAPR